MSDSAAVSTSETSAPPKVFISYSWTSPGHQQMVRELAERLLGDGVDVLIDIFDLKEGHDKFHFMEKMVTDKEVTHVLVVCDQAYASKADAKKAGVGTESQIISSEVYAKVDQEKFIPIACEFSDGREPFLPVFLKSRIWIDFSSPEAVNQNWEKLVRTLHGKPAFLKPPVGKAPAYLAADTALPASPIRGKFASFRQAFNSNARGLNSYRQDFLATCLAEADRLRVRDDPGVIGLAFGKKVLETCGNLKRVRDSLADWVLLESGEVAGKGFDDSLLKLLEDLLELKARPEGVNRWSDEWFEAHSVFVYETFLYLVAALLKKGAYATLHEVFTSHYLRPQQERSGTRAFVTFERFWGYSESLQAVLAPERRRLYRPAAELIKNQSDRDDLPMAALVEADLLATLMSWITTDVRWPPHTLFYSSQLDFPFFLRATQHRGFLKLSTITGITDANALRLKAREGYDESNLVRHEGFHMLNRSPWECLNMEKLDTLK